MIIVKRNGKERCETINYKTKTKTNKQTASNTKHKKKKHTISQTILVKLWVHYKSHSGP